MLSLIHILETETRDTVLNTIENLTAKDIFDAAKSNDTVAAEQVEKMGNILGTALASIACVINPERIVIGGGVSKAGKILIDVIEKHFMEQTFHACRNAEFALAEPVSYTHLAYRVFPLQCRAFHRTCKPSRNHRYRKLSLIHILYFEKGSAAQQARKNVLRRDRSISGKVVGEVRKKE